MATAKKAPAKSAAPAKKANPAAPAKKTAPAKKAEAAAKTAAPAKKAAAPAKKRTPSAAFNALLGGVAAGQAYFNVHSTSFPAGEIRGFLQPVPEPATYALMLGGLALVGSVARRRVGRSA